MRGLELAIVYLCVGVGVALAARLRAGAGWVDGGLLLAFWPLYAPFVFTRRADAPALSAPDVDGRLGRLEARVRELDAVLAQPDFRLEAAQAQRDAHRSRGEDRAAARVEARIASIERLEAQRAALLEGLAEARELRAQLRVQGELMRVAGGSGSEGEALVAELEARVAGLDAMLELP